MVSKKNFVGIPVENIPKDSEYRNCNFSQKTLGSAPPNPTSVRLFPGDNTPRTFIDCNMVNCEPPPGSTLVRCNTRIMEFDKVLEEDVVVVDNVERARVEVRAHVEHGHWDNGYVYLPAPLEYPIR